MDSQNNQYQHFQNAGYNIPINPMYNPYTAPIQNNQQRLQGMERQNPHLMQNFNVPQNNAPWTIPRTRMVTGYEEAKAASIEMDGSLHVFTDTANGCIYTKQLADNGRVIFNTYVLKSEPETNTKPLDIDAAINDLQQKFFALEDRMNKIGGTEDEQNTANNGNAQKQRKSNGNADANGGK